MRVLTETQRTPEWFAAKRGVISASMAHVCLMGRRTKGRTLYVQSLADDLEGLPNFAEDDDPPWFRDGRYFEDWALGWYAFRNNIDPDLTGFVVHDDYSWIGCSPDGLVGADGLVEIKYRKFIHTYKKHASHGAHKPVIAQVHTQMFVTGRRWCDYVNYWRSDDHDLEKGHVQRIYRDDAYIENTLLPAFIRLWEDVQVELRKREVQI